MDKNEKILISGTGRCGTTFLIKIFSFLGMDTGFTLDNYEKAIFKNCNAGMERKIDSEYSILKNPNFIKDIDSILNKVTIQYMIIPIRNFEESAESRERNGKACGGLVWGANDSSSQKDIYNKIFANYLQYMVQYEIPTIFIDFVKMIVDKEYLFTKLQPIFDKHRITMDVFTPVYEKASQYSKPI